MDEKVGFVIRFDSIMAEDRLIAGLEVLFAADEAEEAVLADDEPPIVDIRMRVFIIRDERDFKFVFEIEGCMLMDMLSGCLIE